MSHIGKIGKEIKTLNNGGNKVKNKVLLIIATIGLVLSGCGSSSGDYAQTNSVYSSKSAGVSYDSFVDNVESAYNESYDDSSYERSEADIIKSESMIAREASVSVDVASLEEFDTNLASLVDSYGGYFESQEIRDYDNEWDNERYAYYTLRVPADKLDEFLNTINGNGTVTSQRVTAEDITLNYVDNEARIKSLEDEKAELEELLNYTTEYSDIIQIEDKISDINYNLDSYKSQKRYMEGRVTFSRVQIDATEERNVEHPFRQAFEYNFKEMFFDSLESTLDFLFGLVFALPIIIIGTAFVILFIWIVSKIWRKMFNRKNPYYGEKWKDSPYQFFNYYQSQMFHPLSKETEEKINELFTQDFMQKAKENGVLNFTENKDNTEDKKEN